MCDSPSIDAPIPQKLSRGVILLNLGSFPQECVNTAFDIYEQSILFSFLTRAVQEDSLVGDRTGASIEIVGPNNLELISIASSFPTAENVSTIRTNEPLPQNRYRT